MRIRTFLAKDMKEALVTMRAELGDEAIIVASERLKDGSLCLRAGVEHTEAPEPAASGAAHGNEAADADVAPHAFAFEDRYREDLLNRLRSPKQKQPVHSMRFDRANLLRLLREHRTPESIAVLLVEDAHNSGIEDMGLALAAALDRVMHLEAHSTVQQPAMVLTGPPGSGKTAVAGKLAAQFRLAEHRVALISTDLNSAGQIDRLEGFASCLDLTVLPVAEPAGLAEILREARRAQSLVIADSAGCDPRASLAPEVLSFLAVDGLEIIAVMSALMDAEEAGEMAQAFAKLGAAKLIVTGVDLARRKGTLVALAASGVPIAYVTSSPFLAAGFETLTPLTLARILLGSAGSDSKEATEISPRLCA
jgi:flagellar biosynthesis protein FlhF